VPDERPPHERRHADEFVAEVETAGQVEGLRPRREEAIGRPLDEPASLADRGEHAAGPARRLQDRDPPWPAGFVEDSFGGRQAGHASPDHDHVLDG
jgi:hypothetical protein